MSEGAETHVNGDAGAGKRLLHDPLVLIILGLILTLVVAVVGNGCVAYWEGKNALALEERRLKSDLIIQAIRTSDTESAKENLSFLINYGLIDDPDERIRNAIKGDEPTPLLLPLDWLSLGELKWKDARFGWGQFGRSTFGQNLSDEDIQSRILGLRAEEKWLNEELVRRAQTPKDN